MSFRRPRLMRLLLTTGLVSGLAHTSLTQRAWADEAAVEEAAPAKAAATEAPAAKAAEEVKAEPKAEMKAEAPAAEVKTEAPAAEAKAEAPAAEAKEEPAKEAAAPKADDPKALAANAALWSDFNHYVRIARPDLAQASAAALLAKVDDAQLLSIVENSDYKDYDQTLLRANNYDALKEATQQVATRLQNARIALARDPKRISADIAKLAGSPRENLSAIARIKAAGQFAAPVLLSTLLDERQSALQPYVLQAMVAVGRPIVYPLAVALPTLEPVPQGQVAQVLAEIGYARSIPYLKQVIEDKRTTPHSRQIAEAAYRQLCDMAQLPSNVTAAELFLTLADNHYAAATRGQSLPGFDPTNDNQGIVWGYTREAGLIAIPVPSAIFGDVLAMRAARVALELNPQLDQALSTWLAANLRRENRLPNGVRDLSYPANLKTPSFYLEAAGPMRQHDVLHRALQDSDGALALDAITALVNTAGTEALLNKEGTFQPLIQALSFPDRRVRFAAAFAWSNAQPKKEFDGSYRVVPVLAEALRQSDIKYAVVLGSDENDKNRLAATVKDMGYAVFAGLTLQDVQAQVGAGPGVDLIVTHQSLENIVATFRQSGTDYKLASVPVVAIVSPVDAADLNRKFERESRLRAAAVVGADDKSIKPTIESAGKVFAGAAISAEEGAQLATLALHHLKNIAMGSSPIFKVTDAQPALIEALTDKRQSISLGSAEVLALIPSPQAQKAVADASLDATRSTDARIALLGSLSKSATNFGNHLTDLQINRILDLVKTSQGETAQAAARAHGALTQPTANVVQMIAK